MFDYKASTAFICNYFCTKNITPSTKSRDQNYSSYILLLLVWFNCPSFLELFQLRPDTTTKTFCQFLLLKSDHQSTKERKVQRYGL